MQLNFETVGRGQPLVVLHGLFGSLDNWRPIGRTLSSDFLVILVDLRNHGRSAHHPDMNYALMAQDIIELMDAQGWSCAHVLGHSMGGKTAMEMALQHASRVCKVVVVDIAPRQYPRRHDHILEALLALELDTFDTRVAIEGALAPSIPDLDVRRFLLKSLTRDASGRFRWLPGLREIAADYGSIVAGIPPGRSFSKPSLLIFGSESNYVQAEDQALFRAFFPRSEVLAIRAGHWVHAEAPTEFATRVKEFLKRPD